jgi:tellurite resistance protein
MRRAQASKRQRGARRGRARALDLDRALIALFIGAMNANQHVAADEAARAHHLIWSTRRFRRRSGEAVGKLIQDVRSLLEKSDPDEVMARAARAVPRGLRPAAFAVLADLLLADGRIDPQERRFLARVGAMLGIGSASTRRTLEVVRIKNHL